MSLILILLLLQTAEAQTVGTEFVAVFLENIAYYHPAPCDNHFVALALEDGTTVTISTANSSPNSTQLNSGQSHVFMVPSDLELDRNSSSGKVVTISSTKNISLQLVSARNNSVQTAVLLPTSQLAQAYHLPPIPKILSTTVPAKNVTNLVTERSQFRLVLVNGNQANTISLDKLASSGVTLASGGVTLASGNLQLAPKQVEQILVDETMAGKVVSGTAPFLALFGHPCAFQANCTCGLLFTPLLPSRGVSATFVVPPAFSADVQLLRPWNGDVEAMTLVTVLDSGPVLLQRPGLLMNLIPVEDFGSCFSVHAVSPATNWAVVVAPSASTAALHLNAGLPSPAPTWSEVGRTTYSWTKIPLSPGTHVLWHETDLIGVWLIGEKVPGTMFGNPAAQLSTTPDFRGCVLVPERVEVLPQSRSWQESIAACRNQGLELISLSDVKLQDNIYKKLQNQNQNLSDAWMGLKKSCYSGAWYWISEEPLLHVDWAFESPGEDDLSLCGRISLIDSQRPHWTNQACCSDARPVCYWPPTLLTLQGPQAPSGSG